MSGASPQEVQREHGVLLRQWACAQERVSEQMCAQQRRCAALEAELMRWRARWVVATTHMLWGLGWPSAAALPDTERGAQGQVPAADVTEVLCQVGCTGHAHAWRGEQGQCRLTGGDCTQVPPVARDLAARQVSGADAGH